MAKVIETMVKVIDGNPFSLFICGSQVVPSWNENHAQIRFKTFGENLISPVSCQSSKIRKIE